MTEINHQILIPFKYRVDRQVIFNKSKNVCTHMKPKFQHTWTGEEHNILSGERVLFTFLMTGSLTRERNMAQA